MCGAIRADHQSRVGQLDDRLALTVWQPGAQRLRHCSQLPCRDRGFKERDRVRKSDRDVVTVIDAEICPRSRDPIRLPIKLGPGDSTDIAVGVPVGHRGPMRL
jgi:hypothetical protein